MLTRRSMMALAAVLGAPALAGAATFDIRTLGAIPGDGLDDAFAVRLAVSLASTFPGPYGGTVYIPAGDWTFSSTDPADPSPAPAHVLVVKPGIKFVGDGASGSGSNNVGGPTAFYGTRITSTSATAAAFKLAVRGDNGIFSPNYSDQAGGAELENLTLINGSGAPSATACGITIANLSALQSGWTFGPVTLRNLRVIGFYNGLGSQYGPDNNPAQLQGWTTVRSMSIQDCHFLSCANHGAHVRDFVDLKIIGSEFADNAKDGLFVQTYSPATPGSHGLYAFGCRFTGNSGVGLNLRGERTTTPSNSIADIHLSSCQFSSNGAQGLHIAQARNVQVAGSTVSGNNTLAASNGTGAAVFLGDVSGVGVFGTTFSDNFRRAFTMTNANGVSISACAFVGNCLGGPTMYAFTVNGGQNHTYAALSFVGSAAGVQRYGIDLQNNPRNILGSGLAFEDGMVTPVTASFNVGSARYLFDYYANGVMTRLQQ